ncbi:hypothetical protein [Micrococcus terreus]|uniref:hypothetical protein n=1 Tax=Micrococcus terreus TaxID=574650 RepID=UPI003018FECD
MRIVSGLLALLLGLAALLGGIGLQTIWTPPLTLTAEVGDDPTEAPLTVITGEFAEIDEDPVEYTLTGDGDYTVMLGRERDIQAWIGDAAHNTVKGIQTDVPEGEQPHVIVEHAEGEMTVPNPVDSDLWIETHEASGTLAQRWTLPEEDQTALLIAVDGTAPAPTDVTVTWTNRVGDSPWIVPLLVIGPLLILIGLGLLLWAWLRKRRDGGQSPHSAEQSSRRSGRRAAEAASGQGSSTARRVGTGAAVGLLALTVSLPGPATASPSAEGGADQSATQEGEFIPLLVDQQLERILGRIEGRVQQGDTEQDAEQFGNRVSGMARTMRELNYRNRAIDEDQAEPAPLAAAPVLSAVGTEDGSFPRTVLVVTEGEQNETPHLSVLRQRAPRQQYQLVYAVPMAPGATLPGMSMTDQGLSRIDLKDADGLMMSPSEAVAGVTAYLTDEDDDFKDKMAPSAYATAIQDYQKDVAESAKDTDVSLKRHPRPRETMAFRLPDGSALVFASVYANVYVSPKEEGGTVIASDLVAEVAGESETETTKDLSMRYRELMVLRVPAEGGDDADAQVSLDGFEDELYVVDYQ